MVYSYSYLVQLASLLLFIGNVSAENWISDGVCLIRGECHHYDEDNVTPCVLNDTENREPHVFDKTNFPEEMKVMQEMCPNLVKNDGTAAVCCTVEQFHRVIAQLRKSSPLIGKCPSCFTNFANIWCQFTCSPNQSKFLKILEIGPNNSVFKVQYELDENFANRMFDSCKDVKLGTDAKKPALKMMSISSKQPISLRNWLEFMGTMNLMYVIPMYTDFKMVNRDSNWKSWKCDEPVSSDQSVCGINDCNVKKIKLNLTNYPEEANEILTIARIYTIVMTWPNGFRFLFLVGVITIIRLLLPQVFVTFRKFCHRMVGEYTEFVISHPFLCVIVGVLIALARAEKSKFARNFPESIHRYQQIIFESDNGPIIYNRPFWYELFDFINELKHKKFENVSLADICYRPLGGECAIISPTNYFKNNKANFMNISIDYSLRNQDDDDYSDFPDKEDLYILHLETCLPEPLWLRTQANMSCFGDFGGPIQSHLVFGNTGEEEKVANWYYQSKAMIVTIPTIDNQKSKIWEKGFIELMKTTNFNNASFSFMAESSIDNEILAEAGQDKWVSIFACFSVLIYIILTLTRYHKPEESILSIFLHTKLFMVLLSVLLNVVSSWCSIGVHSYWGSHATDNAIVVLFFINFCMGINRCCITVRNFQAELGYYGNSEMSHDKIRENIIKSLNKTVPMTVSSSIICSLCFFISGGFPVIGEKMPIIETFARYASLAIFIDTIFYLLILIPYFQFDAIREIRGKCEIYPPYRISQEVMDELYEKVKKKSNKESITRRISVFLMRKWVRYLTLVIFFIFFVLASVTSSRATYGFDQTVAFSKSSYLSKHFENLNQYLNNGPPVFFIVEGEVDWKDYSIYKKFCTTSGCNDDSVGNILSALTNPETENTQSYLAGDVYNWVDSFLQYIDSRGRCCRMNSNGQFCSPLSNSLDCKPCVNSNTTDSHGNLLEEPFNKFFNRFLDTKPGVECAHGGYATARVAIKRDSENRITSTHFMTFFKKLNLTDSGEMYNAMQYAQDIARQLQIVINIGSVKVRAYSSFFIHYDQYSTISANLITLAVFVFMMVLGATVWLVGFIGALSTTITLISSFLYMISLMYYLGIEINMISATNLTMSLGITTEFVIQVLYAFYKSEKESKYERSLDTIATSGATILLGIMPSLILTAICLCFAVSPILKIYFGYIFFGIATISTIHAVLFLPAILVTFGEEGCFENMELSNETEEGSSEEMQKLSTTRKNEEEEIEMRTVSRV
ncbi:unnamed protein product [Caenorhabditis angaria]|uniref:SSD domain-containing protein n=1 Tax=Caenorhabditis angaria TaxID=860376 RepID=A0A9P1MYE2_9PELO|nr:unnamed protein product [Caenorhabditis angaria]